MSSTNRGYDRHKSDYYVTPKQPVRQFLERFSDDEQFDEVSMFGSKVNPYNKNYMQILDPAAGGDEENDMTYPDALMWNGFRNPDTIDIREDSGADTVGDYLHMDIKKKYDMIITNPPFHLAQKFVEKSFQHIGFGGYIIMLLRLNFVGGKTRQAFRNEYKPYAIYAHNKRMSFTQNGSTEGIEYAHFVWREGYENEHAKFSILFDY